MNNIVENIRRNIPWVPENINENEDIPKGDMPGDIIKICSEHIRKAQVIFPGLLKLIIPVLDQNAYSRAVVVVCGGSGVGKSEIASMISYYFNSIGVGSYTLSGDNYPHRIPKYNDAERLRIFRKGGIDGLILNGQYKDGRNFILKDLQESGNDSNPELIVKYPWLSVYQEAGQEALKNYLGTTREIDFKELSGIISKFKKGESVIFLKRMGRKETELWYEPVDFSNKNILIIEWTHGNNNNLEGVDIPVLLNSTPAETLDHRKSRNRDNEPDSPFTTMVLEIEQELLISQAPKAKLILSKSGEILSYNEFVSLMIQKV